MKLPILLALLFLVALFAVFLPSCAGYPVTARIVTRAGAVAVDPVGGITAEIDTRGSK